MGRIGGRRMRLNASIGAKKAHAGNKGHSVDTQQRTISKLESLSLKFWE